MYYCEFSSLFWPWLIIIILSFITMQRQPSEESLSDRQEDVNFQQEGQKPQKAEGTLSKKQLKKIQKKEKWEKQKLIRRQEKRLKDKQKKKLKALEAQQKKGTEEEELQKKQQHQKGAILMRRRKDDYSQKMKEGVKVVIDLQFYDLMTEKEQASLIKQLGYCHSVNRNNQKCFNYILSSALISRQNIFAQRYNADKWGITMDERSLLDLFPKEQIIYLTGDAEQEIQEFDPNFVYVIGGIVDHNRLKKITYNYANEHGIAAKRLPMKNVQLKASVHLAVNHVWQWMLRRYNGTDWDEALKAVLPQRKLQNYKEEQ